MEFIKKIPGELEVYQYTVYFDYKTKKGHRKTQMRIIKALNKNDAKNRFDKWSKNQRTIYNAEILCIEEIQNSRQVIEL